MSTKEKKVIVIPSKNSRKTSITEEELRSTSVEFMKDVPEEKEHIIKVILRKVVDLI